MSIQHKVVMDITNEQWERFAPLLSVNPKGGEREGRGHFKTFLSKIMTQAS